MKYVRSFNESNEEYYVEVDMLKYDTAYSKMRSDRKQELNTRDTNAINRFLKQNDLRMVSGDGYHDIWAKFKTSMEYYSFFKLNDDGYFFCNITKSDKFYRCDEIKGLIKLFKDTYKQDY